MPSPLDYVGRRRFAFYPSIRTSEPNEWVLGSASWSEVQVVNSYTGRRLWIPRQYIGAVAETASSLLTVGLTKELEYRAGALGPRVKRVIEMPRVETRDSMRRDSGPAPVIGIRLEPREDSPMNKALVTLGIGAVLSLVAALISAMVRF
jgi:hypothetical protein